MNGIINIINSHKNMKIYKNSLKLNNTILNNKLNTDTFQKSNNITFKGKQDSKEINSNNDMTNKFEKVGIQGAPFLLAIAAATYKLKNKTVEKLLLAGDDTIVDTKNKKIISDSIKVDSQNGIIDIKDTGIHIDENNFDISNPQKGIYKNYDGSVDIDLSKNKYIDLNNGIIVDPENKISAVINDGKIENIVIPNFVSSDINFRGASMSNWNNFEHKQTRSEFIEENNGIKPEEKLKDLYSGKNKLSSAMDRAVDPDDNRSMGQKIADFFNPLTPNSKQVNLYDKSKEYDVFGREVITYKDSHGTLSKVALDENLSNIVNKYELNSDSIGELSGFFEKVKSEDYLLESHSNYSNILKGHSETFNTFIEHLSNNHSDVSNVISHDAINETLNNVQNNSSSFLGTLKHFWENNN